MRPLTIQNATHRVSDCLPGSISYEIQDLDNQGRTHYLGQLVVGYEPGVPVLKNTYLKEDTRKPEDKIAS
jgi:hypothetical protein